MLKGSGLGLKARRRKELLRLACSGHPVAGSRGDPSIRVCSGTLAFASFGGGFTSGLGKERRVSGSCGTKSEMNQRSGGAVNEGR